MRAEAPLGAAYTSRGSQISPLEAERSFNPRNNHNFPESPREFLNVVARELPYLPLDMARLAIDYQESLWEYWELRNYLRNAKDELEGDGSPVVILRGWGGWKGFYDSTITLVRMKGLDPVIAPSDSILNLDPISSKKDQHWDFIKRVAEEKGQKVHLWGQSQGGIEGAVLYAEHPDEFEEYVADFWDWDGPKPRRVNVAVGIGYIWSHIVYGTDDFKLAGLIETINHLEKRGKVPIHTIYRESDVFLPNGEPIGVHHESKGSHTGSMVNLRHLDLVFSWMERARTDSEVIGAT
ncbi:MAG: hypothetical protein A3F35_00565 [Candidatus Woykebacteria bacterium RIFCSPHIGHO2_12_FULL_45_10]|uniref:AB hydrolase-1 domain-containing protein n=1 Tax=Candidatus Woykebacteria bacterium RIFCSPHIGHO2_12_FULL_45_10 TaxID=1802603 RepID=A0A1G1WPL5_9BACT|nr:MAG: hypothetical protein A3F35_00565 [Candidatus Woykebacteria bacterium RIFCSPHIGHO2_12_FULL_45_10]